MTYVDLTAHWLYERGSHFKDFIDFLKLKKTVTLNQTIYHFSQISELKNKNQIFIDKNLVQKREKSFKSNISRTLAYFLQIGAVTTVVHCNSEQIPTNYYSLNTEYGLIRTFLPFYLSNIPETEKSLVLDVFRFGTINFRETTSLAVSTVTSSELRELRKSTFITEKGKNKGDFLEDKAKRTKKDQKYLVLNLKYLKQVFLNQIVYERLKFQYFDLRNEYFSEYLKNDLFTCQNSAQIERIKGLFETRNDIARCFKFNDATLPLNLDYLKFAILKQILPVVYRPFLSINGFLPDDKLSQTLLQPKALARPAIFRLMEIGLIKIVKNGYVLGDVGVLCKMLVERITSANFTDMTGYKEFFVFSLN